MTPARTPVSGWRRACAFAGLALVAACSPASEGEDTAPVARQERAPLADPAVNGSVPDIEAAEIENAALPDPEPPAQAIDTGREPLSDITPTDLPEADNSIALTPFPQEVTDFMVDRDSCDHFRGEEPYDEERRQFLETNIRALCTGSDRKLDLLRRKYRSNPEVIAALEPYEKLIEAPDE